MQLWRITLGAAFLLVMPSLGFAKCGDDPGDATAVATARAQVEDECPCATAARHGQYVTCAGRVAKTRSDAGLLRKSCKQVVKRCAARSTCGNPGFVTCCRTKRGVTKCKIARDAELCREGGGDVGECPSCCDSCGAGSCSTPTSSTTSTTSVTSTSSTATSSTTTTSMPQGGCGMDPQGGQCSGSCPQDSVCLFDGSACSCVPASEACGVNGNGMCGGLCPNIFFHCSDLPVPPCVCRAG